MELHKIYMKKMMPPKRVKETNPTTINKIIEDFTKMAFNYKIGDKTKEIF